MSDKISTPPQPRSKNLPKVSLNFETPFLRTATSTRRLTSTFFSTSRASRLFSENSFFVPSASVLSGARNLGQELDSDLIYCEYLQVLMKRKIVRNCNKKYEDDMKNQIALQKDRLYRSQLLLKETSEELKKFDELGELTETLRVLEETLHEYNRLIETIPNLEEIVSCLLLMCRVLYPKDFNTITNDQRGDALMNSLKKCDALTRNFPIQHSEAINQIAGSITQFSKLIQSLEEKQKSLSTRQKNVLFTVTKILSDMYAKQEIYPNEN